MIETGVVIGTNGEPLFWHRPYGRTGGSIPAPSVAPGPSGRTASASPGSLTVTLAAEFPGRQ